METWGIVNDQQGNNPMCVMSIVHDHYHDQFPGGIWPQPKSGGLGSYPWTVTPPAMPSAEEIERLSKLIKDFREAQEAAAKLDKLMSKPDCVDPEKAKLQERVAELEKQLAAIREAAKP
jgi:hypothetical protein